MEEVCFPGIFWSQFLLVVLHFTSLAFLCHTGALKGGRLLSGTTGLTPVSITGMDIKVHVETNNALNFI